jgi:methyl-accepting chemotaxis protein
MSIFSRIRITSKLLLIILLLNVLAIGMAGTGYYALQQVDQETDRMERVSRRAMAAARAGHNLIMIGRLEAALAASPTPEMIKIVTESMNNEVATLRTRLEDVDQSPTQAVKDGVAKLRQSLEQYRQTIGGAMAISREITTQATPEQRQQLVQSVINGRQAFNTAREDIRALVEMQMTRLADLNRNIDGINRSMSMLLIVLGVAGVVVGLGLGFVIGAMGIARPLRNLTNLLGELAQGRFDIAVTGQERRDEIGDIARAAETFKQNGMEAKHLREEQEAAKARSEADQRALMNRMADEFDAAVGGIVASVSASAEQLKSAAETMTGAASEASAQSNAVAAASEESTTNIQTVASATEELAASVREIGSQVEKSSRMAGDAVSGADLSASQVNELTAKVQKIGEIVELINAIAAQTNLLALNATIEAARAGEAGRGFAVVAAEVKGLADQTAKATTDIAQQINGIQSATSESAHSITGIAKVIRDMSMIAGDIAAAVEEQNAATQEIARNVSQASAGAGEVSSNIVGVSQAVSETGAAATQVLSSAENLAGQASRLREEMGKFLATVRAA